MPDPNKLENIAFRVSVEQKATIYTHAESRGYVTADWLREKVLAALEEETMVSARNSGGVQIPNKEMRELVRPYLDECGATVELGGTGHFKVLFPGVQRPVTVTGTPTSSRAVANTRSELERAKRQWRALNPAEETPTPPARSSDGLEEGDTVRVPVQTSTTRVWRTAVIETLEATRGYVTFTDNGAKTWVPRGQLYRPGTEPKDETKTEDSVAQLWKNTDGQPKPTETVPAPTVTTEEEDVFAQLKAAGIDPLKVWRHLGTGILKDKEAEAAKAEELVAQAAADVASAQELLKTTQEVYDKAMAAKTKIEEELAALRAKVGS